MARIGTAFRSFFAALGGGDRAARLEQALSGPVASDEPPSESPAKPPSAPARSEAVTLLAALQREGRLVDFLMEPVEGFSDEQIGAAARELHRGCRATLDRLLPVEPVLSLDEGERVVVGEQPPGAVRMLGPAGEAGQLVHPGWRVREMKLPQWTGADEEASIVMPAEVQA